MRYAAIGLLAGAIYAIGVAYLRHVLRDNPVPDFYGEHIEISHCPDHWEVF